MKTRAIGSYYWPDPLSLFSNGSTIKQQKTIMGPTKHGTPKIKLQENTSCPLITKRSSYSKKKNPNVRFGYLSAHDLQHGSPWALKGKRRYL